VAWLPKYSQASLLPFHITNLPFWKSVQWLAGHKYQH
jgi:hypothetical protein